MGKKCEILVRSSYGVIQLHTATSRPHTVQVTQCHSFLSFSLSSSSSAHCECLFWAFISPYLLTCHLKTDNFLHTYPDHFLTLSVSSLAVIETQSVRLYRPILYSRYASLLCSLCGTREPYSCNLFYVIFCGCSCRDIAARMKWILVVAIVCLALTCSVISTLSKDDKKKARTKEQQV